MFWQQSNCLSPQCRNAKCIPKAKGSNGFRRPRVVAKWQSRWPLEAGQSKHPPNSVFPGRTSRDSGTRHWRRHCYWWYHAGGRGVSRPAAQSQRQGSVHILPYMAAMCHLGADPPGRSKVTHFPIISEANIQSRRLWAVPSTSNHQRFMHPESSGVPPWTADHRKAAVIKWAREKKISD